MLVNYDRKTFIVQATDCAIFFTKLGHIAALLSKCLARMQRPILELKTQPRARPVSQSLFMICQNLPLTDLNLNEFALIRISICNLNLII
jgi:hypothetical protein